MHTQNASTTSRERHALDELADAVERFRASLPQSEEAVRARDHAILLALERGAAPAAVRALAAMSDVALELAVARATYFRIAPLPFGR
ncbi:hypothetical protein [Georgenia subflava]|uniref:Uncharacterized protein n=1 Tax=Georgenia subflava TaxID=1622177 RepID=A0A6N7EJ87_9MICO|nr:hypothetical protein [Georgenia subflava]MPV37098.1 hypothetical protein [Georgenia subflava]